MLFVILFFPWFDRAEYIGSSYIANLFGVSNCVLSCWVRDVLLNEEDIIVIITEDSLRLNTRAFTTSFRTVLIMVSCYVTSRWARMLWLIWHVPVGIVVWWKVRRSVLVGRRECWLTTLLMVMHRIHDMCSMATTRWNASERRWKQAGVETSRVLILYTSFRTMIWNVGFLLGACQHLDLNLLLHWNHGTHEIVERILLLLVHLTGEEVYLI